MAFFKRNRFLASGPKTSIPDGVWMKCPGCKETVYKNEVEDNLSCCPDCEHHMRISSKRRIEIFTDFNSFQETHTHISAADPLNFTVGKETYAERIERAKQQSGLNEALITGTAKLRGAKICLGIMDSTFIMASMSSALGEKFCLLARDAIKSQTPLVIFAASGGARMQEGILALMQMAKTADAVRQLNESKIPYIVILTDPTTGGVFASFASLGDFIIAEPNAYIGFAGARLIEGALKVKLPDGFQSSEYQFDNGFIDQIVKRSDLRDYVGRLVRYVHPNPPTEAEIKASEFVPKPEPIAQVPDETAPTPTEP